MTFEQAAIKVERDREFGQLQGIVAQAFRPDKVERLLKQLNRKGIRIRHFDEALMAKVFDQAAPELYQSLAVSDQAQIREFYLSQVEAVDTTLRHKFKKLFQYY